MIFRCKYLIAGMAPASELYQAMKSELENNCRYKISDVYEAEVLGPYPEPCDSAYPVVPVMFKFETFGYESEVTVICDLFVLMHSIRAELAEQDFVVGFQELNVDGQRHILPTPYMMGRLPVIEL